MSEDFSGIKNFIQRYRGTIIGCAIGLITGTLILTVGFFSTLFLAICMGIGAFFGSKNKYKKKLFDVLDRILPDIFK